MAAPLTVRKANIPGATAGPVVPVANDYFEYDRALPSMTNPRGQALATAIGCELAPHMYFMDWLLRSMNEPPPLSGSFDIDTDLGVTWRIDPNGTNRLITTSGAGRFLIVSNIAATANGGDLIFPGNQRIRERRGGILAWSVNSNRFELLFEG